MNEQVDGGVEVEQRRSATTGTAIRWKWLISCEFVGLGFIALAFWVEAHWAWKGVAPSTFVNVGTATGLAGVLFLLERRFTSSVVRENTRVVREVEERLSSRTAELEDRLDHLAEATEERIRRRNAGHDALLEALGHEASYSNVTQALAFMAPGGAALVE